MWTLFPRVMGNKRFVIVATVYFTKWVESEALVNICDIDVKKLFWKNIVTRFRVPETLISDNGLQFDSKVFRKCYCDLEIKNRYSMPAYPRCNGQAEATKKTVVNKLKKRLENAKRKWAKELPNVLWAYRTTPRRSASEIPFSMTYKTMVVIPMEISLPSMRTISFSLDENDQFMIKQFDFMEENREIASIRLVDYQQKLSKGYNRNMRLREFVARDLVLQKVLGSIKDLSLGKLDLNWEGSYHVTTMVGTEAYYLEDLEERPLPRPWNVSNLKKYFY